MWLDCSQNIDLLLKSADGKLIGAHRKNMERFSDGFPVSDDVTASLDDIVELGETSAVLELLLHFLHPNRLPRCDKLDLTALIDFGHAAEKYFVYSAMGVVKLMLSDDRLWKKHSVTVLRYAVDYNYPDLADLVTFCAINVSPSETWAVFCPDFELFTKWVGHRLFSLHCLI
ncbi:hypothetical protein C8J56DRAFT_801081 [Mycena floridula]|nr:hypothetical protein C8J56DRAFT_801081 [Mycena floridula]